MKTDLTEAVKFFRENSGSLSCTGRTVEAGFVALANAERVAKRQGVRFEWADDPDEPGKLMCRIVISYKDSLGGIDEADADYRRVVEAQLALEAVEQGFLS